MGVVVDYPEYFVRFYDIIYKKVRHGVDDEFYLGKIKETKGTILEIGVGTGRFFLESLKNGADVYGIDVSQNMINLLKTKLNEAHHSRVILQDATKLNLSMKFDLIIAPFRVFSHLIDVEDQLAVLNNCYDHLNDGGQLIFDLFIPDLQLISTGRDNYIDFEGEYEPGKKIRRITSMKTDLIHQINHVTMKFVWDEDEGQLSKEWYFPFRYFFRYEIEHLIKLSKMSLVKIYGDFNQNELSPESKEIVIVCEKKSKK